MTFRGAGFEATAKRRHSEAGAALVAATVSKPEENATPLSTAKAAKEAVQVTAHPRFDAVDHSVAWE
jgi:hypothetical protein